MPVVMNRESGQKRTSAGAKATPQPTDRRRAVAVSVLAACAVLVAAVSLYLTYGAVIRPAPAVSTVGQMNIPSTTKGPGTAGTPSSLDVSVEEGGEAGAAGTRGGSTAHMDTGPTDGRERRRGTDQDEGK